MLDTGDVASGMRMPDDAMHKALAEGQWHGHVRTEVSGMKARCGGPALCSTCQRERELLASLGGA
jgi:hypothetical protein